MSQDDTMMAILMALTMLLEKAPRTDVQDRQVVTLAETTGGTLAAVTTVTTAADLTRMNEMGSSGFSRNAGQVPVHMSNAGSMHIYNNIVVMPDIINLI